MIYTYLTSKNAIKQIINEVNYHAISFDDAAKIVKACAPYCDEKTADGFIKWLQSWYNTTIPKSVTTMYIDGFGNRKSKCPNCNKTIIKCEHPRFCGGCGQAVYWE